MLFGWLGCAVEADPPTVEAHAAGAGYWPANSRTAVLGAIEQGLTSIELDVVATGDRVPVLHEDPWLDPWDCVRADGTELEDRVRIRALTAEHLSTEFLCGGLADRDHPNALLVEDSVAQLGDIVKLLPATSINHVRLDVHYEKLLTPPAEVLAHAVLEAWDSGDPPQILSVTSDDPAVLAAFDVEAHLRGKDLSLGWVVSLDPAAQELDRWANGLDYADMAEVAGADTLWLPPDGLSLSALRTAREAGVQIGVETVDDPRARRYWLQSGEVDVVSTSYPGEQP